MQRIERYGVIALVLLLVTIATVSFWEGETAKNDRAASLDRAPGVSSTPRDADRGLPATGSPDAAARQRAREELERRRQMQRAEETRLAKLRAARERQQREEAERERARARAEEEAPATDFPAELARETSADRRPNRGARGSRVQRGSTRPAAKPVAPVERGHMQVLSPGKTSGHTGNGAGIYVVQAGDTLGEIALKELGSSKRWPELAALNGGSEVITVGQKLRLPSADATVAAAERPVDSPKPGASAPSKREGTYVVQKGDVLSVIAQRELGSAKRWREIAALNPKINPDRLYEGAVLAMPEGQRAVGTLAAASSSARPRSGKRRVR